MNPERKVILYIAMSVDGYIATSDENLDFLSIVHREGEDYGYQAFTSTIDTVLMGRKTYDWILKQGEYPHRDKRSYIITRNPKPAEEGLTFYSGNIADLIKQLKKEQGKAIFCDGGAELVTELLHHDLMDELIISVIPVLLGEGIRLFKDGRPPSHLNLLSSAAFDSGLVQLHYAC